MSSVAVNRPWQLANSRRISNGGVMRNPNGRERAPEIGGDIALGSGTLTLNTGKYFRSTRREQGVFFDLLTRLEAILPKLPAQAVK